MCTTISSRFIKIGRKTKKNINSPFFCLEFQSASKFVKMVHIFSWIHGRENKRIFLPIIYKQHIYILVDENLDYCGFLALYCLMFIFGLVQAVVSIVASGYSCKAVCCRRNSKYPGTVKYLGRNVIFAPPSNTKNPTSGPAPVLLNA